MLDKFNREITYLRVSVTDMCNLRCAYCAGVKNFTHKRHSDILSYERIRDIVRAAAEIGFTKIRLTGGEPLIKKNIEQLVKYVAETDGIQECAMTTNGVLLADKAETLKANGLGRINISLDTLDSEKYTRLTGCGDIQDVFKGIQAAGDAGFCNTKINMVVIPGTNEDEIQAMREFCREKSLKLQLIRQFSLSEQKPAGPDAVYDRPPACGSCNKIRLLADGTLKSCLHADTEIKLDPDDIKGSLIRAIELKPKEGDTCSTRPMSQIGG